MRTDFSFCHAQKISYQNAYPVFQKLYKGTPSFLLESGNYDQTYGRLSLIGLEPSLEITGTGEKVKINLLKTRSGNLFQTLLKKYYGNVISENDSQFEIQIAKKPFYEEEEKRFYRKNSAQIIREILNLNKTNEKTFCGLYGAFGYEFILQFEEIESRYEKSSPNFHLFVYDTFIFFDHLKQSAELLIFRKDEKTAQQASEKILAKLSSPSENGEEMTYSVSNINIEPDEETYCRQVESAKKLFAQGELMETVFARFIQADFHGDALSFYRDYKNANPSPYMFFFDLGNEFLVGTSPEMMVRCENGNVFLRPISGTAARGKNALEDHNLMLSLLNSEKEKAELDMLIDLGRNDLAKVCGMEVEILDYRVVEKYSRVMHTVAYLRGKLREDKNSLDALVACMNAGTLTGAPKLAAMKLINGTEKRSRGYYGGAAGYLQFSGDMDTAILIRTAHIKDEKIYFAAGATLLLDSDPKTELNETKIKSQAFVEVIQSKIQEEEYADA